MSENWAAAELFVGISAREKTEPRGNWAPANRIEPSVDASCCEVKRVPGAGSAQVEDSGEKRPSGVAGQGLRRKKLVPEIPP